MKHILITDDTHPILVQRLREAGYEVVVNTEIDCEEALAQEIERYDAIVVRSKIEIGEALISRARNLKCIGRVGAGMETIDVEAAKRHGVECVNSPEGNRVAVGEHAVGLLLALLNNIARADAEIRKGLWQREENRGKELGCRTVGIIGFGNMGGEFARCLRGFGCRIMAYDKYKKGYAPDYVEEVDLEQMQREADVVSLHVPITKETKHMVDAMFLKSFAKPIMLINTSRGGVVDTVALVDAMKRGSVAGAALDVLEYEKMAADSLDFNHLPEAYRYLIESKDVVLTPHVAGWTVESKYKLAAVLAEKIIEVLK